MRRLRLRALTEAERTAIEKLAHPRAAPARQHERAEPRRDQENAAERDHHGRSGRKVQDSGGGEASQACEHTGRPAQRFARTLTWDLIVSNHPLTAMQPSVFAGRATVGCQGMRSNPSPARRWGCRVGAAAPSSAVASGG